MIDAPAPRVYCAGYSTQPTDAAKIIPCLSGYHPHPLYVVCLLGLQARAGAGALPSASSTASGRGRGRPGQRHALRPGSYFYTRDIGRAWRVSEALEYGIVGLNVGIISTEIVSAGSRIGCRPRRLALRSTSSARSNTSAWAASSGLIGTKESDFLGLHFGCGMRVYRMRSEESPSLYLPASVAIARQAPQEPAEARLAGA